MANLIRAPDDRALAEVVGGLTSAEASARFAADGPNELAKASRRSALRIVGEVLREPMLALLLLGGLAYLAIGDLTDAIILLAFATFSIVLTVIQESRTEHVLEALRDLSAPRALVVRDGVRVRIAGREVVQGDLLVIEQGDRIAADARLLAASDLQADESLLTGESLPIEKAAASLDATADGHRPGGENQPYLYSGSLVTRGSGMAQVVATGALSEIGKIGLSLAMLDSEAPRLRIQTARIVRMCNRRRQCRWAGGAPLRADAGWLDRRLAGRHRDRHVAASSRIPRCPDNFSRNGRMADRAGRGANAACLGDRDAGVGNGPLHRQDRDADRKPHGCRRVVGAVGCDDCGKRDQQLA